MFWRKKNIILKKLIFCLKSKYLIPNDNRFASRGFPQNDFPLAANGPFLCVIAINRERNLVVPNHPKIQTGKKINQQYSSPLLVSPFASFRQIVSHCFLVSPRESLSAAITSKREKENARTNRRVASMRVSRVEKNK